MADKNENQGSIKKQLSGSGAPKGKKKLVIKKKVDQKKDISEHFDASKKTKPSGPKTAAPAQKTTPPTGAPQPSQSPQRPTGSRPPGAENRGPQPQNRGGGDRRGGPPPGPQGRGGQPGRPQGDRRPQQGGQGSRGGQGVSRVSFAGAGTPFDALLESTRKAASANQAQGRGAKGAGGPRDGRPGGGPDRPDTGGGGRRGGGRRGGHDNENINKFQRAVKRKPQPSGTTVPSSIDIMESVQVGELAKKLNLKPGDVIGRLMKMGEMVTINKIIDSDTAALVAQEFGCKVNVVSLFDETVIAEEEDKVEDQIIRPPVVTIMGHVDHGKTKLLDTIRKSSVIDTEAGAITQHIGAYQVETPNGTITFLDTPGHEAFTAMRSRGAAITDIVILVVAADDGVKEQTKEAITHAKEAGVPIIVAVNKIDLPNANMDKVLQELATNGLQPESWGGDIVVCEISAKNNIGIEHLLEMVLLQAEILNLKANPKVRPVGHVIEARVDAGKGPVATLLIDKGTLREGDPFVVGVYSGKIRAMFDDLGRRRTEAPPATPVEIIGLDGVPQAGDPFQVVESEKYAREMASTRQHYEQISRAAERAQPSMDALAEWMQEHKELKIIVKADVQGSVEAIKDGLLKLSHDDVKVRVIMGSTGAISESDVSLASASNAMIVGFHVRATPQATELAERDGVDIRYYSIIYNVIEDMTKAMEGLLEPDYVEEVKGRAEVRKVFRISRVGNVAGCMVISGKIHRNNKIRILRDNVVIYEDGELDSLKRHKDDSAEVAEGFECGLSLKNYNDLKEGDIVEAYVINEVARTL
ncbi:MAG: translation initiation factor IF-2 [Spirochaetaceae bacterium]|nr:translation initiation factor IF-2 [Spirochaetaceae bacterium]|tara:strand:- start:39313 stop:41745 length:2433 start_codon:yes stop_codon:yes gene_type:complete